MTQKNDAGQIIRDRDKFLGTPPERVPKSAKDLITGLKQRLANRTPLTDPEVKQALQDLLDIEASLK